MNKVSCKPQNMQNIQNIQLKVYFKIIYKTKKRITKLLTKTMKIK